MATTKKQLSEPRQRLLKLLQETNFGQLRNLHVRNGDPHFQPAPLVVKDWKLDGENEQRPESNLIDFALKKQHEKLFAVLDHVGCGVVDEIHIRYGLPCKVITSQSAA